MNKKKTILQQEVSPFKQAGVALGANLIFNLVAWLIQKAGVALTNTISWEISLTLLLFFGLANAIFFLNTTEKTKYWSYSITSFITVAAVSIFVSTYLSGIGINDSASIKWIILIFSFSYLIFISIIGLMRRIVEIAIKQDKRLRGEQ
ncbi:hypothetical protein [Portibacter marinus]|uniref:hypothetical protein n=1 Tax=Portibacter marinus TaxID=2898660 RepID=UPI001F3C0430|nr:hypothetical protein [Portibacter marinus]